MSRIGLWMIGAQGGVSTTVAVGLSALQSQLASNVGLVSELPGFAQLDFADWPHWVIGGHEIRDTSFRAEADQLVNTSRAIDGRIVDAVSNALAEADANIRPGILHNVGPTIESLADDGHCPTDQTARQAIVRIQSDIGEFAARHELSNVVVVNLASTEPPIDSSSFPATWTELAPTLESPACQLPASSLYAIAALENGYPYINFTPSLGSCLTAIDELAVSQATCHAGHDGKTGETFLKSVLAPAFGNRHLEIMSWVGHNIFGNMDGKVLDDPSNKQTKVKSKDKLLGQILGYDPQSHISIEYIQSLGDWKTAWDHIHFRGFLGTPMILQFTWQGCDSILAAPLVLDLARFTELAHRRRETGQLSFLASFFKAPIGTRENDFARQFQMLEEWAKTASAH